jgi:hypothetical protein
MDWFAPDTTTAYCSGPTRRVHVTYSTPTLVCRSFSLSKKIADRGGQQPASQPAGRPATCPGALPTPAGPPVIRSADGDVTSTDPDRSLARSLADDSVPTSKIKWQVIINRKPALTAARFPNGYQRMKLINKRLENSRPPPPCPESIVKKPDATPTCPEVHAVASFACDFFSFG